MIGYVTIGANDYDKSRAFYDSLLAELGGKRVFANERIQFYGGGGGGMVAVCKPHDGKEATVGNGMMVSALNPSQGTLLHSVASTGTSSFFTLR